MSNPGPTAAVPAGRSPVSGVILGGRTTASDHPTEENTVDTRLIAVLALVIAVVVLLILVL